MTRLLSNRDGGKTNEEGHYRFPLNAWSGNVLGDGLNVTQNSPLGMSVLVNDGDARIPYGDYAYAVWIKGAETVVVLTADPSNPRIDRLVMYVDRGVTPDPASPNNPGIMKLALVAGTPGGSPVRPTNGAVNTAVSNNPWIDLADIRVNAGVTQITNANITRTAIPISATLAPGSITPDKLKLTPTTDANGWKVYNYGEFKKYTKRVTFSQVITAGSAAFITISSTNLPAGIAALGTNTIKAQPIISPGAGDIIVVPQMTTASTSLAVVGKSTVTTTYTGFIDVELTT